MNEPDKNGIVLEFAPESGRHGWVIFCPGCKCGHLFDSRWTFNGNMIKPTFRASMLVNQSDPERRCHSYVTDGQIQFLDDCGHSLKGQTVPLPTWNWEEAGEEKKAWEAGPGSND